MKKFKVGIIGNGFVGEAQAFAFSPTSDVRIYDIDSTRSTHSFEEINKCDFVFICVPTPMFEDGTQDQSYINDVLSKSSKVPIYIIKSTVLPGTTQSLQNKFKYLKLVFSPEFLTERTAKLDMLPNLGS